ncbi:hypothetical protein FS837_012753 [Tulasnella sp. UAMH 9824]|nr:hypothetical protein FS837_012753 [Tulasnella sp. UAMH 9824]
MDSLPVELRNIVFQQLGKTDLFSSALTCRAWRDVAWNSVMWRTLTIRVSGLLEILFGEDSFRGKENGDLIPPVSDPNRFLGVAAIIHSLKLNVSLGNGLIKVLLDIAGSTPEKVLFLRLSTLDCGEHWQDDLVQSLFIGSPIRKIVVSWDGKEESLKHSRRLLSSLLKTQPQVRYIDAGARIMMGLTTQELLSLPELCTLDCYWNLTYERWANLIQKCPKLERLSWHGYARGTIPTDLTSIPAPSLRWLHLDQFGSWDVPISVLESTNAHRLENLNLRLLPASQNDATEDPTTTRARHAFRLLAERSQQLESLTLKTSIKFGAESLALFRSLRTMRITDHSPGCQLDDEGVELLCHSLPSLETFNFHYINDNQDGDAKMTPKSLKSLTRHCRNLTDLGLSLTATDAESLAGPVITELVPFGSGLKSLKLAPLTLPKKHVDDFVSFLLSLCPSLAVLEIQLRFSNTTGFFLPSHAIAEGMQKVYFERQAALQ